MEKSRWFVHVARSHLGWDLPLKDVDIMTTVRFGVAFLGSDLF